MPSKSFSQARMMAGASHDPVFAKKVKVPQKVAKEYNMADKRSGFLKSAMRAKGPAYQEGGSVDASKVIEDIDREAEAGAKKRAEDAKKRESQKPLRPRSDARNPDRAVKTPKVFDKPPQAYAKGGAVRGAGAAKRGMKPARFY